MDAGAAAAGMGPGHEGGARQLPTALVLHVMQRLPPNEVPCTARLLCKELRQMCSSPEQRAVRLSTPLPPHAGAWWQRWEAGLPRLPFRAKLRLLETAAASGCETNLEVAWRLVQPALLPGMAAPPGRVYSRLTDPGGAAARHGHGHLLPWLLEHRCPLDPERTLAAAAEHCDLAALRWTREHVCPPLPGSDRGSGAVYGAAQSRTPDALDKLSWLLSTPGFSNHDTLCARAAATGDVARLQWLAERGVRLGREAYQAALRSPAAGVEALEWLERQGAGSSEDVHARGAWVSPSKLEWAALRPGAQVQRPQWAAACVQAALAGELQLVAQLHEVHGAALSEGVWGAAVCSGAVPLLAWLRSKGCPCPADDAALLEAAYLGRLTPACLAWLLSEARTPLRPSLLLVTIQHWPNPDPRVAGGQGGAGQPESDLVRVVRLLAGAGTAVREATELNAAAKRGDLALVQLLHALGGTWDKDTLEAAAEGGCEELLAWLVGKGAECTAAAAGAYVAAGLNGDAATLRALARLRVPAGRAVQRAVRERCTAEVLQVMTA